MRLRLLFSAFASLRLGLFAVATGGVRALALTFGQNAEDFDRYGVVTSIVVGLMFLAVAVVPPPRTEDD